MAREATAVYVMVFGISVEVLAKVVLAEHCAEICAVFEHEAVIGRPGQRILNKPIGYIVANGPRLIAQLKIILRPRNTKDGDLQGIFLLDLIKSPDKLRFVGVCKLSCRPARGHAPKGADLLC